MTRKTLNILIVINSILLIAFVALFTYAIFTAEHWTKIDVPEHKETFHTEQRATGRYIVTMDNDNPCYVGMSWVDCTNAYIAEYNRECTKPLVGSISNYGSNILDNEASTSQAPYFPGGPQTLHQVPRETDTPENLCKRYGAMIDEMKKQNYGYVASLGDYGHLSSKEQIVTKEVSNNDYRAAVTHEAICYLGFLGECPETGTNR